MIPEMKVASPPRKGLAEIGRATVRASRLILEDPMPHVKRKPNSTYNFRTAGNNHDAVAV